MKIAVAGTGYVGLSLAVLLSQSQTVYAYDVNAEKISKIRHHQSPIQDDLIEKFLTTKNLNLSATIDYKAAYSDADFVIVAVPTNYNPEKSFFDTSIVESSISQIISVNPKAVIVIKSTIPVGYTKKISQTFKGSRILFSPEFLRESKALYDNLYPSRIIVGTDLSNPRMVESATIFGNLLKANSVRQDAEVKIMSSTEAEAVKLFANTFLALRVAFFNELDTYAIVKGLDSKSIIDGICLDPRIGGFYNNPSFGYGGYCLPKDTKQLLANYAGVPQNLIKATVDSNNTRKEFIAQQILECLRLRCSINGAKPLVGVYRLTMKSGSDNFRESSIQDVIRKLRERDINVVIYEPMLKSNSFDGCQCISEFTDFAESCDLIVANRLDSKLSQYKEKVFSRDIFYRD